MKILLSGASSFTGFWFANYLSHGGHQVLGLYQGEGPQDYTGTRHTRVKRFAEFGRQEFGCTFGKARFLEIACSEEWDVYCHHASEVSGYRSLDFDPVSATRANTLNLRAVLKQLGSTGCDRVIFTGSIFERGEGLGSDDLPAFSPYGVSKNLSWEIFLFECRQAGFGLGKFVIPNPFGALEEPRFTHYLASQWKKGQVATCHTPDYIRDNIPVELLALEYRRFVEKQVCGVTKINPSGYIESQGAFTERVAREFRSRTNWECKLVPTVQKDFPQPLIRLNSEPAQHNHEHWDESAFWDGMVDFYDS